MRRIIKSILNYVGALLSCIVILIPLELPILKLFGVISWSWWAVLSPLILLVSTIITIIIIFFVVVVTTAFALSFTKGVTKRAEKSGSTNDRSSLN